MKFKDKTVEAAKLCMEVLLTAPSVSGKGKQTGKKGQENNSRTKAPPLKASGPDPVDK